MVLRVEVVDNLTFRLREITEDLGNTSTLMRRIAGDMESSVEDNFEGQHNADGVPWAPLSEPYRTRRFARGFTGPILQVTGRGAASFSSRSSRSSAIVGTNVAYMRHHHTGTSRMPSRRVLGFGKSLKRVISVRVFDYLSGRRR